MMFRSIVCIARSLTLVVLVLGDQKLEAETQWMHSGTCLPMAVPRECPSVRCSNRSIKRYQRHYRHQTATEHALPWQLWWLAPRVVPIHHKLLRSQCNYTQPLTPPARAVGCVSLPAQTTPARKWGCHRDGTSQKAVVTLSKRLLLHRLGVDMAPWPPRLDNLPSRSTPLHGARSSLSLMKELCRCAWWSCTAGPCASRV